MTGTSCRILVVADGDSEELAAELGRNGCQALPAPDWQQALRFLREGPFHPANRPNLIVLHLEKVGSSETLAKFRQDPYACVLPLIVLLEDASPHKVLQAYGDGARAVVHLPREGPVRASRLADLSRFWCESAVPPPSDRPLGGGFPPV